MDITTGSLVKCIWIFLLGVHSTYGQSCPNGDVINEICYTIVRVNKNYADAKAYCEDNSGYLASITDADTQTGIKSLAESNSFSIPELWIGATEEENTQADRIWKWVNNDSTIMNQGCYTDSSTARDLSRQISMNSATFSVATCLNSCNSESYRYAGLQNGALCFCGNSFGSLGNATSCTVACPTPLHKASIPYCGGTLTNTIIDLKGSYTRWGYQQPNNHKRYQKCAALDMDLETKTVDEACHKRYRYICDAPSKATCSGDETGTVNGIYYSGSSTSMCYLVSRDAVSNWYVAHRNCKQISGRLTIVNTQQIHSELSNIINNVITSEALVTSRKLWIGLRRGGWTWDTGEAFVYTNWMLNKPDSWQAKCAMMTSSNDYMWEDRSCSTPAFFVCQGDNIPVPTTTTTTAPTITTTASTGAASGGGGDSQPSTAAQQTGGSGLTTDEIILLVIVLVLFVVAVLVFGIIVYYCCTRKSRRVDYSKNSSAYSDRRIITGPQSNRSGSSLHSNEFIDINDQTDYYNGSSVSYRY